MNDAKTITSKNGLKFLVEYDDDKVYIGLHHTLSWAGQIIVYEAVEPLKLKCTNRFITLNGVYSPIFFMGEHTPEEIEKTLENFSKS